MAGQDRPPRSRRSSRQQVHDEYSLIEGEPSHGLTEVSAAPPAALHESDEEAIDAGRDAGFERVRSAPDARKRHVAGKKPHSRGVRGSGREHQYPHGTAEEDPESNLTELLAPAPTNRSEGRSRFREGTLEPSLEAQSHEESEKEPAEAKQSPFESVMTQVFTLSYLVFFSILGVLARLGLQWLTFYPGAPVITGVLWANFAGSFLMGFFSEDRLLFRDSRPSRTRSLFRRASRMDDSRFAKFLQAKKSVPLYIGLTTGFCGTFTSFSSFIRDAFLALSNDLEGPYNQPPTSYLSSETRPYFHAAGPTTGRNGGYSFMAVAGVIILTVCLSISALQAGGHFALAYERLPFIHPLALSRLFTGRVRAALDWCMPVLAIGSWLGAVFMAIWPPDRPGGPSSRGTWNNETWRGEAIFACVFAPLGCLVRYYASQHLNALQPAFPLGTFAVNVFGTAVEGMAWDLQRVPLAGSLVGGGRVGCQVLQGVMDGFCGALTTVSTWALELNSLRRSHGWFYGTASVGVGLALWVVIVGSVRWTIGFSQPACVT